MIPRLRTLLRLKTWRTNQRLGYTVVRRRRRATGRPYACVKKKPPNYFLIPRLEPFPTINPGGPTKGWDTQSSAGGGELPSTLCLHKEKPPTLAPAVLIFWLPGLDTPRRISLSAQLTRNPSPPEAGQLRWDTQSSASGGEPPRTLCLHKEKPPTLAPAVLIFWLHEKYTCTKLLHNNLLLWA